MNIFCVIVTYNGMKWADRCFGSLRASAIPISTIVIDNASTDGTVRHLKENFPEVDIIESSENLGFAKANNIGIRKAYDAGADYILLLNQDAWIENNTLTELLRVFDDNENVGIASPIHLNGNKNALDFRFHNCMSGDLISDLYMQKVKPYYESSFVNAAAWLMSRRCIETVGGFDTLLFYHYGEDVNYAQRVHFHHLRFIISTHCTICHDREDRKSKDYKLDDIAAKTERMDQRLELGDINNDPGIPDTIKQLKHRRTKKILRGRLKAIPIFNKEIHFLQTIEDSRTANKKTGLTWL